MGVVKCETFFTFIFLIASAICVKFRVSTSEDFHNALGHVLPGDEIELNEPSSSDPNYPFHFGNFVASRNGTFERPIKIYGRGANVGLTTDESFIPALAITGNHWIVKGFRISTLRPNGGALGIFRSQWTTVEDMQINSSIYGVHVWGGQQILIRNCSITSADISIRVTGNTIPVQQNNVKIVGNTIVHGKQSTLRGESYAVGIFVAYYGPAATSSGLIADNLFLSTSGPYRYWVFMGGSNYTIRNNTGSSIIGKAGFYVAADSLFPAQGTGNTFQTNHCPTVTNGYCILVDNDLMNSTCISSDNTFGGSAVALSNVDKRCDTHEPGNTTVVNICEPGKTTTVNTETSIRHLDACPDMIEITLLQTITTKVVIALR